MYKITSYEYLLYYKYFLVVTFVVIIIIVSSTRNGSSTPKRKLLCIKSASKTWTGSRKTKTKMRWER